MSKKICARKTKNFFINELKMKLTKNKKGFSFLEVMITVAVLSIGILAMLALIASSIGSSTNSRNSIIASELAQEGIELVRNIRDNNFISNPSDPFINLDCNCDWKISYDTALSSGGPYQLNYDSGGFYSHSSGTATKFYRKVGIILGANASRIILSTAWWNGDPNAPTPCNIANKCVYIIDTLADWW